MTKEKSITGGEVDVPGNTPSSKPGGCDYMSFSDAQRLFQNYIDCEMRDPCGLNDTAKAMLAYWRMVDSLKIEGTIDHLASTGRIRGEWRPISEAPRDGSLIILTRKRINKRFTDNAGHFKGDLVCTGKWKNNTWMTYPGNNRSEPKSGFTHWMPLPAAPGGE